MEEGKEEDQDEDPVMAEVKKKVSDPNYSITSKNSKDPIIEEVIAKEAAEERKKGFLGSLISSAFGELNPLVGRAATAGGALGKVVHAPVEEAFSDVFNRQPPRFQKPNLTLDNMERKLLLQELMMTDPILSRANPAKVARAFEQILRLSPEISKEKEVVRAELRAMVSTQALSKYDADLMSKLDTTMLKRRVLTQAFNKGQIDNFKY